MALSAEVKIRTLAIANATMQSRFGTPPALFRWFDTQLDPQRIPDGTCLRALRISTYFRHVQAGLNPLQEPLFQFDVLDRNPETARAAAVDLIAFLRTVDLSSSAQFGCPTTTPQHYPTFIVNQRPGMEPVPDPPVYVESVDVRFFNLQE